MAKETASPRTPKAVFLHQDFRKIVRDAEGLRPVVRGDARPNTGGRDGRDAARQARVRPEAATAPAAGRGPSPNPRQGGGGAAARKYKVGRQMGNQGPPLPEWAPPPGKDPRLMQEWVAAGAIGPIREVHCWTNRPVWPQGFRVRPTTPAVPEGLDGTCGLARRRCVPTTALSPVLVARVAGLRRRRDGRHGLYVMDAAVHVLKLGYPPVLASEPFNVVAVTGCRAGWQGSRASCTTTATLRRRSSTCRSRRAATCPP